MNNVFPVKTSQAIFLGVVFSIGAILSGFTMGAVFGAAEDVVKNKLEVSASNVFETVYKSDADVKASVIKKSWEYLKRAHMHWGAIGSASLSCILALVLFCRPGMGVNITALMFGAGALIYPLFWFLAGIYAPSLGSTGAAKKMLEWMALPGAGFCLLGAVGTLFCLIRSRFSRSDA